MRLFFIAAFSCACFADMSLAGSPSPSPQEVPLLVQGELKKFQLPKPVLFNVAGFVGGGQFDISLPLPQASGLQPAIGLSYRSQRSFGNCGVGCDVSLPSIRKDNSATPVQNLSGWALVEAGVLKRLKRSGRFLFPEVSDGPIRVQDGPAGEFILEDGSGNTKVFGGTSDTERMTPAGSANEKLLARETNSSGVAIVYKWKDGELEEMSWGTPQFNYRAQFKRTAVKFAWPSFSDFRANETVLDEINVLSPSGVKAQYRLSYDKNFAWPHLKDVVEVSASTPAYAKRLVTLKYSQDIVRSFKEVQSSQLAAANAAEGRLRPLRSTKGAAASALLITSEGRILLLRRNGDSNFIWQDIGKFGDGAEPYRYRISDLDGDGVDDLIYVWPDHGITSRAIIEAGELGPEKKWGKIVFQDYREDIDQSHYRNVVFQHERYIVVDVDGNGQSEIVFVDHHGNISVGQLKTGDQYLTFSAPIAMGEGEQLSRYAFADMNGDGDLDLLLFTRDGRAVLSTSSSGVFTAQKIIATGLPLQDPFKTLAGDWNADGLLDFGFVATGSMRYLRNRGPLGDPDVVDLPAPGAVGTNKTVNLLSANGDRIADFMVVKADGEAIFTSGPGAFASASVKFLASSDFLSQSPQARLKQWFIMDLNGDDRADLVSIDATNYLRFFLSEPSRHSVFSDALVEEMTNEYGGVTAIEYGSSAEWEQTNMPSVIPVVRRLRKFKHGAPLSEAGVFEYEYRGGLLGFVANEFRGFREVLSRRLLGTVVISETAEQFLQGDSPSDAGDVRALEARYAGVLKKTQTTTAEEDYVVSSEFDYAQLSGSGPWIRRTKTKSNKRCDSSSDQSCLSTSTSYTHDQFGNPISDVVTIDAVPVRTVVRSFNAIPDKWILNALAEIKVTDLQTDRLLEHSTFDYATSSAWCPADAVTVPSDQLPRNRPTRMKSWADATNAVVTEQTFDKFGNTICLATAPTNWQRSEFDPSGTVVVSSANSLGHLTKYSYFGINADAPRADLAGLPASETDPNKVVTRFAYDELRRLARISLPDCATDGDNCAFVTAKYMSWGKPGQQRLQLNYAGGFQVDSYLDAYGRIDKVTRTGTKEKRLTQHRAFDGLGRLLYLTMPRFEGQPNPGSTKYHFNGFDEPVRMTYPDGQTKTVCRSNNSTTYVDAMGRQIRDVMDGGGRTTRREFLSGVSADCPSVNAAVNLWFDFTNDGVGRILSYTSTTGDSGFRTYDARGQLLEARDTGSGVVTHRFGGPDLSLLETKTADKSRIVYNYDALGRVLKETLFRGATKDKEFSYAYDDAKRRAVGRLFEVRSPDGTERISYDVRGDVVSEAFNSDVYDMTVTHKRDARGRVLQSSYSSGQKVSFDYDGDFLSAIKANTGESIEVSAFTALGQPGLIKLSNGLRDRRTYSSVDGNCGAPYRLCLQKVVDKNEQVYFSQEPKYDGLGRLVGIALDNGTQNFTFDARGKLLQGTFSADGGSVRSFSYDEKERLIASSKTGSVDYEDAKLAAAPKKIGGVTVKVDPMGRISQHGDYDLRYDARGSLTSVRSNGDLLARFGYNANGRRIYTHDEEDKETAVFPFQNVRCAEDSCEYWFSTPLGVELHLKGKRSLFLHRDVLNNPVLSSDRNGEIADRVVYGPTGEVLKKASDGEFPELSGVGFQYKRVMFWGEQTFANGQSKFELLDFGSRAYETGSGLFLQPDIVLAERLEIRALARHSYGGNNSIWFEDPTGAWSDEQQKRLNSSMLSMGFAGGKYLALQYGLAVTPLARPVARSAMGDAISAAVDLKAALSGNPNDAVIADIIKGCTGGADGIIALAVAFAITHGDVEATARIAPGLEAALDWREILKNPQKAIDSLKKAGLNPHELKTAMNFLQKAAESGMDASDMAEALVETINQAIKNNAPEAKEPILREPMREQDIYDSDRRRHEYEQYEKWKKSAQKDNHKAIRWRSYSNILTRQEKTGGLHNR